MSLIHTHTHTQHQVYLVVQSFFSPDLELRFETSLHQTHTAAELEGTASCDAVSPLRGMEGGGQSLCPSESAGLVVS